MLYFFEIVLSSKSPVSTRNQMSILDVSVHKQLYLNKKQENKR